MSAPMNGPYGGAFRKVTLGRWPVTRKTLKICGFGTKVTKIKTGLLRKVSARRKNVRTHTKPPRRQAIGRFLPGFVPLCLRASPLDASATDPQRHGIRQIPLSYNPPLPVNHYHDNAALHPATRSPFCAPASHFATRAPFFQQKGDCLPEDPISYFRHKGFFRFRGCDPCDPDF